MGFFGDLWKGAKKAFTHIKEGVGHIIGDKAGVIASAVSGLIPGVGALAEPIIEKGIRGVGKLMSGGPNKGGSLVNIAKQMG
tara:strand:- start:66 stop:311 length:246 start_codon:yes stop_codon:yes gene_type:complete